MKKGVKSKSLQENTYNNNKAIIIVLKIDKTSIPSHVSIQKLLAKKNISIVLVKIYQSRIMKD